MKVFKTIVWTSLFWILALVGLWSASFFDTNVVSLITTSLPNPVWETIYNQGLENGQKECSCPSCEVGTGEILTIDTEDQNLNAELSEETTPQLLPADNQQAQTPSEDELTALQNKVAELEKNHWALVQELQAIFSTPEGMKLLPAPTPVTN